jgi:hypothetical protein
MVVFYLMCFAYQDLYDFVKVCWYEAFIENIFVILWSLALNKIQIAQEYMMFTRGNCRPCSEARFSMCRLFLQ